MSVDFSQDALSEFYSQESSNPFLTLITLTHDSFDTIRLVNNTSNIISYGNTFLAFPVLITLPPDDGETQRNAVLEMDNVSRDLVESLRAVSTPIAVKLQHIFASDPNDIELELDEMKLQLIRFDAKKITADIVMDNLLNTRLGIEKYDPRRYPGLFN